MNYLNYILPTLIFDSLVISLGHFFAGLQPAIFVFVGGQLLALLLLGCFSPKFSDEDKFYFGLLILGFVFAVGMGVV